MNIFFCKICNTNQKSLRKFGMHLKKEHNILYKDYLIHYENVNSKCPICGKERTFISNSRGFANTCGNKDCINKYNKKMDVYSKDKIEKAKEKRLKTVREKYGVDNVFQSEEKKKKIKEILKDRHGVEHPLQDKDIMEKSISTKIKKYGNKNYNNVEKRMKTIKSKSKDRLKEIRNDIKILEILDGNLYKCKCNKCGNIFEDRIEVLKFRPRCLKCFPLKSSLIENFIENILKEINIEYIKNDKKQLDGYELDFYLPDYRIAIECHGNYWHCEKFKDKNYHYKKWKWCVDKNIKLLQFFEDEILYKTEIIKSMIKNQLNLIDRKIYARKCKIKEIDNKTSEIFFIKNHINGYVKSSIRYGLFYDDELISCISLAKNRFKGDGYEITRFATKLNIIVVGGFTRLLKNVCKRLNGDIYTFADCRFSNFKNVYKNNGFEFIEHTKPNYYYVDSNYDRYHRANFMKHKLKDKLEKYHNELTEYENMALNGYYRVYDSGNLKYKIDTSVF
ncbi:MAG: DUF7487 domain-containing protein [Nanoarchaeota archaeon]